MALRPYWRTQVGSSANRLQFGSVVMAWGTYVHGATSSSDVVDFSSLVTMASTDYKIMVHRRIRSGGVMDIQDSPMTEDTPRTTTTFTLDYGSSLVAGWEYDWMIMGEGSFA